MKKNECAKSIKDAQRIGKNRSRRKVILCDSYFEMLEYVMCNKKKGHRGMCKWGEYSPKENFGLGDGLIIKWGSKRIKKHW